MKPLLLIVQILAIGLSAFAQDIEEININQWGAKGDGKTNNTQVFRTISDYVSKRKGNVKITIPPGTYLVGKQTKSDGYLLNGGNVLNLNGVKNVIIEGDGQNKSIIMFVENLYYGSFDPQTMKAVNTPIEAFNKDSAARIGNIINVDNSDSVIIRNLELNGNNSTIRKGGEYYNIGIQLSANGIVIGNSSSVTIKNIYSHHFALDGIIVSNIPRKDKLNDNVELVDSRFSFNGRQGLSWVGGNGISVKNCMFDNTGMGPIFSLPGTGVDIEAEVGPNRNGIFENCTFENNKSAGLASATGDNADCSFNSCIFWGSESYTTWIAEQNFIFSNCKFYGIAQHGYAASNANEATKYKGCFFSDQRYKGKRTYGGFLIDASDAKRMNYENCEFEVREKKIMNFYGLENWHPDEYYSFKNCTFRVYSTYPLGTEIFTALQTKFQDCILETNKNFDTNNYYIKTTKSGGNPLPKGILIRYR